MNITGRLSSFAKTRIAETFCAMLDGGTVGFYDGDQPSTSDADIVRQRLIITVPLPDPAFGKVKNGVAKGTFVGAPSKAIADGSVNWCRCYDRDGNGVIDGSVGVGPDFFCDVASTYVEKGGTVVIKSIVYRSE